MLSYILNLLMGFDHYMYDVSFTGVKCETLGPCYSEPCDENNTKSSCTEINNLTDYTCSCKTGGSHLFHFTPSLKFSGLCGFPMASHAKVLLYIQDYFRPV